MGLPRLIIAAVSLHLVSADPNWIRRNPPLLSSSTRREGVLTTIWDYAWKGLHNEGLRNYRPDNLGPSPVMPLKAETAFHTVADKGLKS